MKIAHSTQYTALGQWPSGPVAQWPRPHWATWSLGHRATTSGFTLIEVILGAMVIAIAIAAILGAYVGQVTLNEHARNLSLAVQDANRVIEQIRQQNSPCGAGGVSANFPPVTAACTNPGTATISWDDWLQRCGGGKSIQPAPATNEFVVMTCQNQAGGAYCSTAQMGLNWHGAGPTTDPLRVTIAICWRHRGRVIGECTNALAPVDGTAPFLANGFIESPAMLTTLVTCR